MDEKRIKEALLDIEKQCTNQEVGAGRMEEFVDTKEFYEKVKGLMTILKG